MYRNLSDVLKNIDVKKLKYTVYGREDIKIKKLSYDSRAVEMDSLFFALDGLHVDGHDFIKMSIKNGAKCIVFTKDLDSFEAGITYIKVDLIKEFMSFFAASFYNFPSKKLKVIGVTGTDGKSSVSYYTYNLLKLLGKKVGLITTVFFDFGDGKLLKNSYRLSTPESTDIQAILYKMVLNGAEFAVVESTSHGLDERNSRLKDVEYDIAIMTNVTHEHLEFHKTIENYKNAKLNLFKYTANNRGVGIVNLDDKYSLEFINTSKSSLSYSLYNNKADIYVENVIETFKGTEFNVCFLNEIYAAKMKLIGLFNIENILSAILAVYSITGIELIKIIPLLEKLNSIKGRLYLVDEGQDFFAFIDYAHTPSSFDKILPIFRKLTHKRLIVLFGSAGERDKLKRSIQGSIADKFCDIIILSDEDPRAEPSLDIISEIKSGIKNKIEGDSLFLIPDRREAIKFMVSIAKKGDCILSLGKGHESSIIYKHFKLPWNEEEVLRKAIRDIL